MEILLGIVVLAVLLWVAVRMAALSKVEARLDSLQREVSRLQRQLDNSGQHPGATTATSETSPVVRAESFDADSGRATRTTQAPDSDVATAPGERTPPPLNVRPPVVPFEPVSPSRRASLEERLGRNWLNRLGVVTLVLGLALFLGYQLRTLGPAGKSALGLALSLALLGGGVWLERKPQYRAFARAGIGGGWALLFFVTFALSHIDAMKVLDSEALDLVLMLLVAVGMVVHSLRYRSQVVTAIAFLLAFGTVAISDVTLFSLVAGALLAGGLAVVAARAAWFELALAGMLGTYLNHFLWLHRVLPHGAVPGQPFPDFFASAGLLVLYWAIFRAFYLYRLPANAREQRESIALAILDTACLLALLKFQSTHPEWAFPALLTLGCAEMLLAFVGRRRSHSVFVVLSSIASVLLVAAIPFHFSNAPWTLLWLLQAEILLVAGLRLHEMVFRRLGLLASVAAALQAIIANLLHTGSTSSISAFTLALTAAVLWANAEYLGRPRTSQNEARENPLDAALRVLAGCMGTLAAMSLLYLEVRSEFLLEAWTLLAVALLAVATLPRISNLSLHASAVLLAAAIRGFAVNLSSATSSGTSFFASRVGTVGGACVLMLLALPLCFRIRRNANRERPSPLAWLRGHPEQPFFFIPLLLATALLTVELRAGSITVGWIGLGLAAFVLALFVGERSFRLGGLGLLLLGLGKIVIVDIWSATPTDRYITLIITGAALLLVSFLYSRYRETILRLL